MSIVNDSNYNYNYEYANRLLNKLNSDRSNKFFLTILSFLWGMTSDEISKSIRSLVDTFDFLSYKYITECKLR